MLRWYAWTKIAIPQLVYWSSLAGIIQVFAPSVEFKPNSMWQDLSSVSALLIPPIILTLGLRGSLCMMLLCFQAFLFINWNKVLSDPKSFTRKTEVREANSILLSVMVWCLFTVQYFFKSGHTYEFNSLQWAAAFVGFEDMNMIGGGVLMFLNTFGPHIILTLQLPILLMSSQRGKMETSPIFRGVLMFLLFFALKSVLTSTFVFLQRRHLMVWRVFAPKYIFDNVTLLVIDILVVLLFFIMRRSLSHLPNGKLT